MAVPKKRVSKQRKRKRRNHHRAEDPKLRTCPECGDPKQPHRVCASCGYYREEAVVEVDFE